MELEETSSPFTPVPDRRPHMPEPPPVRLIAVADVELSTVAGLEREMDRFYVDVLGFERDASADDLAYRSENFKLCFRTCERPADREELRPVGITVFSLPGLIEKLNALEMEYTRQRGLGPGKQSLLLRDPAGNWVEVSEMTLLA
jgi:catechol 2,3-dioxygenase-like lactoylglutathione lyase family enzyme